MPRPSPWLWPALLAATLIAYFPVWRGAPVWDDEHYLTVPALRSLGGLWRIWFDVHATPQYYPMAHTVFWIVRRLSGDATIGYHLINIACHATVAYLLARILTRLRVPGAMLAAVVFALHPVHVESVAWMTELKNTLSGVFGLTAVLFYLDFDDTRRWPAYAAAIVLFVLALLSKSATATLPAALLVVFWWKRGRVDLQRDVVPLVPFFAVSALSGALTSWVERTLVGASGSEFQMSLLQRALIAGRALWFYLGSLVWPARLTFVYPRWTIDAHDPRAYLWPVGVVGLLVAAWAVRRWSRGPLAALLLFGGMLFPTLGFFNVYYFRYSFVADHFQYLPDLAMAAFGAAAFMWIAARRGAATRQVELVAAVVIGLPLGTLTWRQTHQFTNLETLYRVTLARNPSAWMANDNLGVLLATRHDPQDLDEAIAHFQAALATNPSDPETHNNFGNALVAKGALTQAADEYRSAIRLRPGYGEAHYNLAGTLDALGKPADALAEYAEAVRVDPTIVDAHLAYGRALRRVGRDADALRELDTARHEAPDRLDVLDELAAEMNRLDRPDDAMTVVAHALHVQPDDAGAHHEKGRGLDRLGHAEDAIHEYEESLRLQPHAADVEDDLGYALVRAGHVDDGVAHIRAALRLQPAYAPAREHLADWLAATGHLDEAAREYAAAHDAGDTASIENKWGVVAAELGRMPDAIAHFEAALRIDPDFADAKENLARAKGGG